MGEEKERKESEGKKRQTHQKMGDRLGFGMSNELLVLPLLSSHKYT